MARESAYYRVGIATDPQPENPYLGSEQEAIEKATAMANAYGFNVPVAVWDDRDEPLYLFLLGEQFKRV